MYEKFTDRARKAMTLANQEARRLGHEYVGTEHILLGLIKENTGVAANVLTNLKIDAGTIRKEVERLIQVGSLVITMGKLPHMPRAEKVVLCAMDESRLLGHRHVGTEHLLVGLIMETEGIASQVLVSLGARLDLVRDEIKAILHIEPDAPKQKTEADGEERPPSVDLTGMDRYIGCKIIAAKPMDECAFLASIKGQDVSNQGTRPGYLVVYPDGYKSWSPKEVFEVAHRKVTMDEIKL